MKKSLILAVLVTASAILGGCGFSNCNYPGYTASCCDTGSSCCDSGPSYCCVSTCNSSSWCC